MAGFGEQCRKYTDLYEKRMQATARTAVQNLVKKAERVRGSPGGKFPIDTGFLRASGGAAIGALPRGPGQGAPKKKYQSQTLSGVPLPVALAQWDFEQRLVYGWTAVYARKMEARYKFMFSAAQLWDRIVAEAAKEARNRIR